jgi:hypothetical protein
MWFRKYFQMVFCCSCRLLFYLCSYFVIFEVLIAASMKITAFWDIVPHSLIEVDWRFRGAYCLHRQCDDGLWTSETLVYYETTWHYIPEGCHLHAGTSSFNTIHLYSLILSESNYGPFTQFYLALYIDRSIIFTGWVDGRVCRSSIVNWTYVWNVSPQRDGFSYIKPWGK